jgi:hypothetical protein
MATKQQKVVVEPGRWPRGTWLQRRLAEVRVEEARQAAATVVLPDQTLSQSHSPRKNTGELA